VKISTLVRLQRISQRLQLAFFVKNSLVTIISAMLIMILYTHWFACGFIYMVRMEAQP
jgi:phosphoglycerate-specific signal transduction histidine kinase